jgi:uncharacterized protein (TIGR02996 family)
MPEREAFLRTIGDNPDDDGPRHVFADWLEERGDPYGEFIRLQCERNRLADTDRAGRQQLTSRLDELSEQHEKIWRQALPRLPGVAWGPFHRGLVESIRIDTAERFLRHASSIFAVAPVRLVDFTALDAPGSSLLSRSEYLSKLTALKSHGIPIGDDGLVALVNSAYIAGLRRLFVGGNGLTDEAARAIARSCHLGKLITLFLNRNRIGDLGARALAESKQLPSVMEVFLAANDIRAAAAASVRARWGDRAYL